LTIVYAEEGNRIIKEVTLTPVTTPAVEASEIHDVFRTYELRSYVGTAVAGSNVITAWAGLTLTYTP